jgi:O-acetyl-ADP-ribose deacetylase (regulator of RNase III)
MADLKSRIQVTVGDITRLDVDAVVTAANVSLAGGGGVDGAVHAAAGPELVAASGQLAPCPAGQARITPGFRLGASHVIHAVGPIYRDGQSGEADQLASAYRSSLALAAENGLETIAFPCISTGVYGYPKEEACRIATDTAIDWLRKNELPRIVTFCCYASSDGRLYVGRLEELGLLASE